MAASIVAGISSTAYGAKGSFDGDRAFNDLRRQVALGPRPAGSTAAKQTARLIVSRLDKAGARSIGMQRRHRNVHATLRGADSDRTIIVGAHYDTKSGVPRFQGANDGASGVAVLLELARSLPRPLPGASIELVFFDAEEPRGSKSFQRDGARGSRHYVRKLKRGSNKTPPLSSVEAMILFDMVGDCDLQIPREGHSDPALYAAFADAEADVGVPDRPVFGGETAPILDDHTPFIRAGIPAVDLIDFQYGPGPRPGAYWHTPKDSLAHVCSESIDRLGEVSLLGLTRLSGP